MTKFRKLGFLFEYDGVIKINKSLLTVVLPSDSFRIGYPLLRLSALACCKSAASVQKGTVINI
jgi:hypothetical protein